MICDKLMCSHWLLRGLKFMHTDLLTWLTFAPWVARKRAAASLFARAALCMRQFSKEIKNTGREDDEDEHRSIQEITVDWGYETAPVVVSGASGLLPLWISWAAKLFSSNEVPLTIGASSSNGFTEGSEDTVIYCRASHRAVLPSWSLSSRSSLTKMDRLHQVTHKVNNSYFLSYELEFILV